MAIKENTSKFIHLQALLLEFGETQPAPTMVHIDNKAARDTLISNNFSKRLKHVPITHPWLREELVCGVIDLKLMQTHQQPIDFFTEPLPT